MLHKKYNLKKILKQIENLIKDGNKHINLLGLLTEISFDPRDIGSLYRDCIGKREYYIGNKRKSNE